MFKFRECSPAGVLSCTFRRRFTKASNADFQLTKLRISFFIAYYLVKYFTDEVVFSVKNPLSPVFPLPPNDFFEPPHTIRSLFAIRSLLRGGWLGVGWGLPGGCLGVPRGPSLPTPRQPPLNPLSTPTEIPLISEWVVYTFRNCSEGMNCKNRNKPGGMRSKRRFSSCKAG